ncbi:conserved hypothetical protein, putative [gamma proteobacterium HTCC5015]|nr:conserved hypothetical protein, putative [gamma proteobacterium HTCC5015]
MWFEDIGKWRVFAPVRQRVNRWTNQRIRHSGTSIVTHGRSIYVIPTRFGLMLAALLFLLLLGAMNYTNSMAFMLTFLVTSIAILGMHFSYANLVKLEIAPKPVLPIYAGQSARFIFSVKSLNARQREMLWLGNPEEEQPPGSTSDGELVYDTPVLERGYFSLPRTRLWTCYPFGLFFVWSWLRFDTGVIVYPKPIDFGVPLSELADGTGQRSAQVTGDDDFAGIRRYQITDSPNRIAWKSLAHSREWMSKAFEGTLSEHRWLDYQQLDDLSPEQRLSQLAYWILESEREHVPYGLRLPQKELALGSGLRHQAQCLEALALCEVAS